MADENINHDLHVISNQNEQVVKDDMSTDANMSHIKNSFMLVVMYIFVKLMLKWLLGILESIIYLTLFSKLMICALSANNTEYHSKTLKQTFLIMMIKICGTFINWFNMIPLINIVVHYINIILTMIGTFIILPTWLCNSIISKMANYIPFIKTSKISLSDHMINLLRHYIGNNNTQRFDDFRQNMMKYDEMYIDINDKKKLIEYIKNIHTNILNYFGTDMYVITMRIKILGLQINNIMKIFNDIFYWIVYNFYQKTQNQQHSEL